MAALDVIRKAAEQRATSLEAMARQPFAYLNERTPTTAVQAWKERVLAEAREIRNALVVNRDGYRFMVCEQGAMVGDEFPASIDVAYAKALDVHTAAVAGGDDEPLVTIVLIGPQEWRDEWETPADRAPVPGDLEADPDYDGGHGPNRSL